MRVARTDWTDWYVDGDRSAVFIDGRVMVLSELATSLLHHVGEDTAVTYLADALVETFGPPEGGDAVGATETAVRDLVASGVLAEVVP